MWPIMTKPLRFPLGWATFSRPSMRSNTDWPNTTKGHANSAIPCSSEPLLTVVVQCAGSVLAVSCTKRTRADLPPVQTVLHKDVEGLTFLQLDVAQSMHARDATAHLQSTQIPTVQRQHGILKCCYKITPSDNIPGRDVKFISRQNRISFSKT